MKVISLGDSHAGMVVSALVAALPSSDYGVMEWSYSWCSTISGQHSAPTAPAAMRSSDYQCARFISWAKDRIEGIPKDVPVVITNRTSFSLQGQSDSTATHPKIPTIYFTKVYDSVAPEFIAEFSSRLVETACAFAKDRRVFMVRPIPEMLVNVPVAMSRAMALGGEKNVFISLADYHQRHAMVWAAQDAARDRCGVKILDPLPYLCWDGRCHGAKDGRPLYSDHNHLSEHGNKLLVPMFAEIFQAPPRASAVPKL